jgi:hypothetical protein
MPATLEQLQRWMQSVIMHPGDVAEALAAPDVRQHLEIAPAELDSVIRRSRAMSADARLEIYVNAYFERLLECLREEFPATRQVLHDELFDALAFGYLRQHPSRSYTLARLGAEFPSFLEQSTLHARARPDDAPHHWERFVIELAAYERLLREVFDSPGNEDQAPLELGRLLPPEAAWDQACFVPGPAVRLARYELPVHDYWRGLKDGLQPPIPAPRAVCLVLFRRRYVVERRELSLSQFALFEELFQGHTLGQAISRLARSGSHSTEELSEQLGGWFAEWAEQGLFCDVHFPAPPA